MSYEGYMQRWCSKGHYWKTPDAYHSLDLKKDRLCPICGEHDVAYASVDETNCEEFGKIPITDRLPILQEMEAGVGLKWHRDMIKEPKWFEFTQNLE